jgi:predicted transcriptional regulator
MSEKIEHYNWIPYHIKENAGYPVHYYELTIDQKFLVDKLLEIRYIEGINDATGLSIELEDLAKELNKVLKGLGETVG